jgi:hypothetical protein
MISTPAVNAAATVIAAPYHTTQRSCRQVMNLWVAEGGRPRFARLAAAEATAESGRRWYAVDHDSNGTEDRGLFQINSLWGSRLSTFNAARNTRAAVIISHDGTNWHPWVSYQNGTEIGKCGYR